MQKKYRNKFSFWIIEWYGKNIWILMVLTSLGISSFNWTLVQKPRMLILISMGIFGYCKHPQHSLRDPSWSPHWQWQSVGKWSLYGKIWSNTCIIFCSQALSKVEPIIHADFFYISHSNHINFYSVNNHLDGHEIDGADIINDMLKMAKLQCRNWRGIKEWHLSNKKAHTPLWCHQQRYSLYHERNT